MSSSDGLTCTSPHDLGYVVVAKTKVLAYKSARNQARASLGPEPRLLNLEHSRSFCNRMKACSHLIHLRYFTTTRSNVSRTRANRSLVFFMDIIGLILSIADAVDDGLLLR